MAHPLLFPIALDILPVQALAVPCERIFSSSKETCALRRSLLSASTLEVLQVLKQLYKGEQLQFVSHLLARRMTTQLITQLRRQYMSSSLRGIWRSCGICLIIWRNRESRTCIYRYTSKMKPFLYISRFKISHK
jgi:hypothetical protein